jgi:putative sigma-54 modulation protein
MSISYAARQFDITPAIKRQAEQAHQKICTVLGIHDPDEFALSLFFTVERRSVHAEVRGEYTGHKFAAEASAGDGTSALIDALAKLTNQAHKLRSRIVDEKRRARKAQEKLERERQPEVEHEQNPDRAVGVAAAGMQTIPVVVHDFPARVKLTETHLVRSEGAVAKKRISVEEAVKELEFNDRDVYVFRDKSGTLHVLYRSRDGKLELIEVP